MMERVVVFRLADRYFGLDIKFVDRAIQVVTIHPLPEVKNGHIGIINFHEKHVAVIDMRLVLGIEPKEIEISDQLILTRGKLTPLGMLLDQIVGVAEFTENQILCADTAFPEKGLILGSLEAFDKLIYLIDYDRIIEMCNEEYVV